MKRIIAMLAVLCTLAVPVLAQSSLAPNNIQPPMPIFVWDGTNYHAALSDTSGNLFSIGYMYDGTANQRLSNASAANQSTAVLGPKALVVAGPGVWTAVHVPSTATQATITKAAGAAGVRHICTLISASIANGATASTPIQVYLRDGATGAGTIIWAGTLSAPANGTASIHLSGLNIVGSAATAMTLEFSGAGPTASQEVVTLDGYDTI